MSECTITLLAIKAESIAEEGESTELDIHRDKAKTLYGFDTFNNL